MTDSGDETHIPTGIADDETPDFLEWRERVRGANISARTLLATDYLNHFNEIAMLVEMVPDMPDMIEDCRAWRPKSYREHFRDSGFSDGALAIEAYDHVPARFRITLEATVDQMDAVVASALDRIAAARECGDEQRLHRDCMASVEMMRRIIQVANAIIHGNAEVMDQAEIDDYLRR
jgi:hypothetical protein